MINGYWVIQRYGTCDDTSAPDFLMAHSEDAAFKITRDLNVKYMIRENKPFHYVYQYVDTISREGMLPLLSVAAVIDGFDKDIDDPLKALQLIASRIGLYKKLIDDETLDDYYNEEAFKLLTNHDN
mgnify:CR=1 FL=1